MPSWKATYDKHRFIHLLIHSINVCGMLLCAKQCYKHWGWRNEHNRWKSGCHLSLRNHVDKCESDFIHLLLAWLSLPNMRSTKILCLDKPKDHTECT